MLTPAGNCASKSRFPDESNSEKYGSAPQPTKRLPSAVVCAFPCDAATWPSGWFSDATSVAVWFFSSSLTVTTLLCDSSGMPADSLSKNV